MEFRIIDETQDISIDLLGGGVYRLWIDAFSDQMPHHKANYWAEVDREGLLDILESCLEPEDYAALEGFLDATPNTVS